MWRKWLMFVILLSAAFIFSISIGAEDPPRKSPRTFSPTILEIKVPVISSTDQLDKNIGRLVALRGVIVNSKPPQIIGVEVVAPDDLEDLDKEGYAIGILAKFTITVAEYRQIQEDARKAGNVIGVATPGPGVHYRLFVDLTGTLAKAQKLAE